MREFAETYRRIAIYRVSEDAVGGASPRWPGGTCYEAEWGGWRIVGPLARLREQIDRLLDADYAPPKHKSLPMI